MNKEGRVFEARPSFHIRVFSGLSALQHINFNNPCFLSETFYNDNHHKI
jgi:hypothetical protein